MATKLAIKNAFAALYIVNQTGDIEADEHLLQMNSIVDNTLNIEDDKVDTTDAEAGSSSAVKLWAPQQVNEAIKALEQKTIRVETGAISNSTGKNSDFAVVQDENAIYFKVAGAWVKVLEASAGNALSITSNAAPASGAGQVGDFNIDVVTGILTEKTDSTTWVTRLDSLTREISFDQSATNTLAFISANRLSGTVNGINMLDIDATSSNPSYSIGRIASGQAYLAASDTATNLSSRGEFEIKWYDINNSLTKPLLNVNNIGTLDAWALGRPLIADQPSIGNTATGMVIKSPTKIDQILYEGGNSHTMLTFDVAGGDPQFKLGKDNDGQFLFDTTTNRFQFTDNLAEDLGLVLGVPAQGDLYKVNASGDLVRFPLGQSYNRVQVNAAGTDLEYIEEFPNRNAIESNPTLIDFRYNGTLHGSLHKNDYLVSARLELDLVNWLGASPTVSASTTISVEIFNKEGKRLVGGAWEYDTTKDLAVDTPDASDTATNDYGSSPTALNIEGVAVGITGWSDVASTFAGSSINTSTHKLMIAWDKRTFALENKIACGGGDDFADNIGDLTMVVSVQESDRMISNDIKFNSIVADSGMAYAFHHKATRTSDPIVAACTGAEVIIYDPFNAKEARANLVGRGGMNDSTNPSMTTGQGKAWYDTLNFTNVNWDEVSARVNIGWLYSLPNLLLSAPSAWYGAQTANNVLWLAMPNASYADPLFAANFDFEEVALDPFSGDTINTSVVTGCFDDFDTNNGRTTIWAQDQPNEMYAMTYDGTNYNNVSTVAWTVDSQYLMSIFFIDIDTKVVISRNGNTGNTSFELYEYSSGSRYDQASWTRTLILASGQCGRGLWNNGTSNGKPTFYSIHVNIGAPMKYEYNGTVYVESIGSAVNADIDDGTTYLGEVQGVDLISSQDTLYSTVYAHAREKYNRRGYCDAKFDLYGTLKSTFNHTTYVKRNNKTPWQESTLIY